MAWPNDDEEDQSPPAGIMPLVADKPESSGAITDAMGNPYVSIPYAVLSAFLAGASPGTARASQALNAGLGMGMASEKNAYDQNRRRRLSEAIGKISSGTTPVATDTKMPSTVFAPDTGEGSQPMSEMRLSEALKEIPTHKITEDKPNYTPQQQAIMKALSESGNGPAVLAMMGQNAFKAPRPLAPVRPGGALINPDTGAVVYQAPAAPAREVTPPRPVFGNQGGEGVNAVFNPETKKWDVTRNPLTPAPARLVSPEETAKTVAETARARAQTAHAAALATKVSNAVKLASDPNVSREKLTTELSVALRDQKNARDSGDDEGLANATVVVNELRQSLARRAKERNAGSVGEPMDTMPDPKAHKGKILRDTKTGTRLKSDGKNWVPIEDGGQY